MSKHNFPVHMEVGDIWGNSKEKFLVLERHEKGESPIPQWVGNTWVLSQEPSMFGGGCYRYYYYCLHLSSGRYVVAYSNDDDQRVNIDGTVNTYRAHLTFPADHSAHGKTLSHPKGFTKPQRSLWKCA